MATAGVAMIEDQVSYGDAFEIALSLTEDLQLVGRAADGPAGIEMCVALVPDLVVCDYRLPAGQTGTQVARRLREIGYSAPLVLLTGFAAPQVRREAAEIRDVFVLSKDSGIREIITDLRLVISGEAPKHAIPAHEPDDSELSPGELEVLELLCLGTSPAEQARMLHLSLHTIRSRIKALYRKLDVSSQGEAIAVATRRGLIVPPT